MRKCGRLEVSIGNELSDDSMRVIFHDDVWHVLFESIISGDRANNRRHVIFRTPDGERRYPFEDFRQAILAFIDETIATKNDTYEDLERDAENES